MTDDSELLSRYVELRSEADFAVLVERHIGSVYHAALRRTGGQRPLAQDVTQEVFLALAQNARSLRRHTSLAGWLYVTARNTTAAMLRREQRRQLREEMAHMNASDAPDPDWDGLRDQLDGALDALSMADRDALLLRYFHNRAFADIGAMIGRSEDAARKRVDRALERLRHQFTRRGITSTTVALGTLLSAEAAQPVPVGLSHAVVSTAAASGGTAAALAVGTVHFMGAKTIIGTAGLLGLAGLLVIPSIGVAVYQHNRAAAAEARASAVEFEVQPQTALLKKLSATETSANAVLAELQRSVDETRIAVAALPAAARQENASGQPPLDQQRADGDKFIANSPEARGILMDIGRHQIHRNVSGFYRMAGLTQAQIDDFETRTAEFWLQNIALTPNNIHPTVSNLPDDQLKEVLGDDGFQKWQEYQRVRGAYGLATAAATRVGFSGAPLSEDQVSNLAQIVANNNRQYQSGGKVDEVSTDWDAVAAEAQKIMSPEQYSAFQATLLQQQYRNTLSQAQKMAAADFAKGNP
jgi:RNA polymerase sigma factor (sigma-70 family)